MTILGNWKGLFITFGVGALSLLLMAPADIVEVSFWLRPLHKIAMGSHLGTVISLCEMTVVLADRVYLPLAFVLNVFLLFRRQAPVWLKVIVWILFALAVLGAVNVESEIIHDSH